MKIQLEITEESIKNIVKYVKEHPDEIKGLIQFLGDEVFEILLSRRVLKKGATLYRAINAEINYAYKKEDYQ